MLRAPFSLVTYLMLLLPTHGAAEQLWVRQVPRAMSIDLKSSWAGTEWLEGREPAGRITHELRGKVNLLPGISISPIITSLSDAVQEDGERIQRNQYSFSTELTPTKSITLSADSSLAVTEGSEESNRSRLEKVSLKFKPIESFSVSFGRASHDELYPFIDLNSHQTTTSNNATTAFEVGAHKLQFSAQEVGDRSTGGEVFRLSLSKKAGSSTGAESTSLFTATAEECPSAVASASLFDTRHSTWRCGPERYSYKLEVGSISRRDGDDIKEVVGSIMRPFGRRGLAKLDLGAITEGDGTNQVMSGWLHYFF